MKYERDNWIILSIESQIEGKSLSLSPFFFLFPNNPSQASYPYQQAILCIQYEQWSHEIEEIRNRRSGNFLQNFSERNF